MPVDAEVEEGDSYRQQVTDGPCRIPVVKSGLPLSLFDATLTVFKGTFRPSLVSRNLSGQVGVIRSL